MNVLLIAPDLRGTTTSEGAMLRAPNLGQLYIASALREKGHTVFYKDPFTEKGYEKNLFAFIKKKQIQIIGVSTLNNSIENDCRTIHEIRKKFPKVLIVVGGWFAATRPGTTARWTDVDIVVKGEGEFTFQEIADCAQKYDMCHPLSKVDFKRLGDIPGLIVSYYRGPFYMGAEKSCKNTGEPQLLTEEALDLLPTPAWDLVDFEAYWGSDQSRNVNIVTSRGCCFNCKICVIRQRCRGEIRNYTIKKTIDLIKAVDDRIKPQSIAFSDDTFTVDKKRTLRLCKEIVKCKRAGTLSKNLEFSCSTRAGRVDGELLKAMKRAGFTRMRFGFESGSQRVLDEFGKGISVAQIRKTIRLLKKYKMDFAGYLILTSLNSEIDDLLDTLDLMIYILEHDGRFYLNPFYIAAATAPLTAEYVKDAPELIGYIELNFPYFEGGEEKEQKIKLGSATVPKSKALGKIIYHFLEEYYEKDSKKESHDTLAVFNLFQVFKSLLPEFEKRP